MGKAVKSYWAYSNTIYRLVMLVLIPFVYILISVCLPAAEQIGEMNVAWMIMLLALYFLDAQGDYWFMGGFYAKHNGALEFLQTSNQFQPLMQRVVFMDILRRVFHYFGLPLIGAWIGISKGYGKESYQMLSYLPILEFFLAQLVVTIGRHFMMWNHVYVSVMLGFIIITISVPFCMISSFKNMFVINAVLLVLAIIMAMITMRYTEKKVRESYYDQ